MNTNKIKPVPKNTTINIFKFARMYKVGGIPIMDFIFVYIILYFINHYYLRLNYKSVLIATIPTTIFIDFLINPNLKISNILLIIMVLCLFYLFIEYPHEKLNES